jgi:hypothetical protein
VLDTLRSSFDARTFGQGVPADEIAAFIQAVLGDRGQSPRCTGIHEQGRRSQQRPVVHAYTQWPQQVTLVRPVSLYVHLYVPVATLTRCRFRPKFSSSTRPDEGGPGVLA